MLETHQQMIRFADVLDVVVLAGFFYVVLTLIRTGLSRPAVAGLALLAAIYSAARLLNMYMVETVIRGLALFVILALAIVFQTDIRRMVEWVGLWASPRRTDDEDHDSTIELLTEAAAHLAEERTGALIALSGRESWDRLIDGGIELDGRLSLPLFYSLFDSSSPGHDGAVLIEGNRLLKFGVHLPLSTILVEIKTHGTRHAAAVGLAEQCDALIIVVSEEYGTINVAHGGHLVRDVTPAELTMRLRSGREDRDASHRRTL